VRLGLGLVAAEVGRHAVTDQARREPHLDQGLALDRMQVGEVGDEAAVGIRGHVW
jgi:hypothetical protein